MKKTRFHLSSSLLTIFAAGVFGAAISSPALADCSTPSAPAGGFNYVDSSTGFEWCDGTNWQAFGSVSELDNLNDAITDYVTDNNMFVGDNAGANVVPGSEYNTIFGQDAFDAVTTNAADYNTALGHDALGANTSGSINTSVGYQSLFVNTSGSSNNAFGSAALNKNTSGSFNVALGRKSLFGNTTGSNNIAIGYQAGDSLTTGSNNIIIGYDIDAASATGDDQLNIGDTIYGNLSTGNVGIGASSPSNKLDIRGSVAGQVAANIINNTASGYTVLRLGTASGASGGALHQFNGSYSNDGAYSPSMITLSSFETGGLGLHTDAAAPIKFFTNGNDPANERMRITSVGNVGIGTTAPEGLLHVAEADFEDTPLLERTGQTANNVYSSLRLLTTKTTNMSDGFGGGLTFNIQDDDATINTVAGIYAERAGADDTGDIVFKPYASGTGNERMRIEAGGNVGIGTSAPGSRLDIKASTTASDGGIRITSSNNSNTVIAIQDSDSGDAGLITAFAGGVKKINLDTNDASYFTGGSLGIGDTSPDGTLLLDVEGQVGATEYCDEDGANCIAAASLGGGATDLNGLSDAIADYSTTNSIYIGQNAGINAPSTAQNNIVIGVSAFDASATSTADGNTGIGFTTLTNSTSASKNTTMGYASLYTNSTGSNNAAFGYNALKLNTTGSNNIAIGYQAGDSLTTGSNNIIIGYDVDAPSADSDSRLNIGNTIYGDLSTDSVGIGTSSPTERLQIKGGAIQQIGTSDNWTGMYLSSTATNQPKLGFRVSDNSERFRIHLQDVNGTSERLAFIKSLSGESEVFSILKNGNVGIGDSAPAAKLAIVNDNVTLGGTSANIDNAAILITHTGDAGKYLAIDNNEILQFGNSINIQGEDGVNIRTGDQTDSDRIDAITILANGDVGIGTTTPESRFHFADPDYADSAIFERTGQTADSPFTSMRLLTTKTTDMADGFGSALGFSIQDDAGTINPIASIGAVRAGADNTGDIVFKPSAAGSFNERMRITSAGDVIIGDTSASGTLMLDVNGQVGATEYCDEAGANCIDIANVGGASTLNDLSDAKTDYVTDNNMFIGNNAGTGITSGAASNTIIGINAFDATLTNAADNNTAIGYNALSANTSGAENTTLGVSGLAANTTGSNNTGLGRAALAYNTTGSNNVAIGYFAGTGVNGSTVSENNVFVGYQAAKNITTGSNNIALGYAAGDNITTGSNNIIIGYDINAPTATDDNQLNIGNLLYGDLSTSRIGIGVAAPITTFHISDTAGYATLSGQRMTISPSGSGVPELYLRTADSSSSSARIMAGTGSKLYLGGTTSNDIITIDTTNNRVGINDTTPSQALEVVGRERFTSTSDSSRYLEIYHDNSSSRISSSYGQVIISSALRVNTVNLTSSGISGSSGSELALGSNGSYDDIYIDTTGNVGIGDTTPSYKLDVSGNMQVQGSSTTCTIGDGSGATNCSSDERLKENITQIPGALDKITQLRGVTFNWKDKTKDQTEKVGVIAQDVEKVFPQVVGQLDDEMKTKTVDYAALVAPLIEAVKELKAQNESLRTEIEALKAKIGE